MLGEPVDFESVWTKGAEVIILRLEYEAEPGSRPWLASNTGVYYMRLKKRCECGGRCGLGSHNKGEGV